jgi:hypothetical protein
MGVSCTIWGWKKPAGELVGTEPWCRFEVVDGKVVATNLDGGPLTQRIMALDPLSPLPGVYIPQSDAEAWVKGLPWYFKGSEVAGIMDDGSIPPYPVAPEEEPAAPVETAEQAVQGQLQNDS